MSNLCFWQHKNNLQLFYLFHLTHTAKSLRKEFITGNNPTFPRHVDQTKTNARLECCHLIVFLSSYYEDDLVMKLIKFHFSILCPSSFGSFSPHHISGLVFNSKLSSIATAKTQDQSTNLYFPKYL